MVYRLMGTNAETKDAIQDIMLKLWNNRKKLHAHPNLSGYIFLTARNHCLDLLKKNKLHTVQSSEEVLAIKKKEGHESYEYKELIKAIEEILKKCPLQHSEILFLRDIDGLEYREIAEITGLTVEHVRVVVSRTRKFVQKHLKKSYHYE